MLEGFTRILQNVVVRSDVDRLDRQMEQAAIAPVPLISARRRKTAA
jgi:hypothetical protein